MSGLFGLSVLASRHRHIPDSHRCSDLPAGQRRQTSYPVVNPCDIPGLRERRTKSAMLFGVRKSSAAARAFFVVPFDQCCKGGGLRNGHDRFESQWGAIRIVAVRDAADRMAEYLDRRLRDVLVIVRGTSFSKIFECPGHLFPGFDICLGLDAGQIAELLEPEVGTGAAAEENRIIGAGILRHDALDVAVNGAIHSEMTSRS